MDSHFLHLFLLRWSALHKQIVGSARIKRSAHVKATT